MSMTEHETMADLRALDAALWNAMPERVTLPDTLDLLPLYNAARALWEPMEGWGWVDGFGGESGEWVGALAAGLAAIHDYANPTL